MKLLLASLLLAVLTQPGLGFEHASSGLKLDLPAGFELVQDTGWAANPSVVVFSITTRNPALSRDFWGEVCKIGYRALPERSERSQAELNDAEAGDLAIAAYRQLPVPGMKVLEARPFLLGTIAGTELVATSKHVPDMVMLVSSFETPAGRTSLTCSAPRRAFAAVRPVFEAIRAGVTPPL